MKRFLLLTLVAVVTLSACSEDSLEYSEESRPEITLQLSLSESSIVQTRVQSPAETTLNNLWLFVFNSSGTLTQKSKARIIRNDVRTADFTIKEGSGQNFYVCANVSAAEEAKFDGLANGSARVADLKAITSDRSLLSASGLPMCGELLNQTITAATTKIPMTLARSCSRVDVVANSIADFGLYGIEKLLKTAIVGPIFPAGSLVAASSTIDVVPTNKALYSIYLYENAIVAADEATAESKATAVIVRGTYKGFEGYYKLRIKYGAPVKYDIGRNIIYSINITNVKAPGFATLAEAEANFPQNVDYTITVSDGDATDLITSNGQYYLGVTNSEYVAYNSNAINNEAVVTVTHNAPSSITAGTVTATGAGLTLRTATIPTSTQKQEIRVDMTNYFTSGTLTLRLGNLIKVITITKKPTINMSGGYNSDYIAISYVQGDWDQDPTWFRFATNGSMNGFNTRRVQNPSGGIWLRFDRNIDLANTTRSTRGYVTSIDSKGRSRIVVTQESGVLEYVSGVPAGKIPSVNPAAFTINVKTDLPGWTIKAKNSNMQPIPITLGAKTGTPVRGTPTACSISVTVPNNLGIERYIYLYLCASEDPMMEIAFATPMQEEVPASISIDRPSQGNIPAAGGSYTVLVTSNAPWSASYSADNIRISPMSGSAGVTSVNISLGWNGNGNNTSKPATFTTTYSIGNSAIAYWTGYQDEGYYIPASALIDAGWPNPPSNGLRLAPASTDAPKLAWNYPLQKPGNTQNGLGAGIKNMAAMPGAAFPAAQRCRNIGPGWYLPSVDELSFIYNNRAYLGATFIMPNNEYWSSSVFDNANPDDIWIVLFAGGYIGRSNRSTNAYARCVCNF